MKIEEAIHFVNEYKKTGWKYVAHHMEEKAGILIRICKKLDQVDENGFQYKVIQKREIPYQLIEAMTKNQFLEAFHEVIQKAEDEKG